MILSVICLLAIPRPGPDRLELRSVGAPVSKGFVVTGGEPVRPTKTLFFNGRKTNYTVPNNYDLVIRARNRQGHVIGMLDYEEIQGDPMMWTTSYSLCFTTARGKIEILEKGAEVLDDRDRVFSCPVDEQPMMPTNSPHLFMWQNGKTRDLGPAYGWRLHKDGSIDGYYVVVGEAAIEPYNFLGQDDIREMRDADLKKFRFRRFVWKNGRRTDSKELVKHLPFAAAGSRNWWP